MFNLCSLNNYWDWNNSFDLNVISKFVIILYFFTFKFKNQVTKLVFEITRYLFLKAMNDESYIIKYNIINIYYKIFNVS